MNAAIASWLSSKINCQQIFGHICWRFLPAKFPVAPAAQNDSKRGIMGHYTIRTNDDEDQAIKKAQEATGRHQPAKPL
ncbi:hypothetical protein [Enterobacter hormaechei]|uniref:hypothetical protein n=1 Tax=Enterobacter hormaechei TaxID=158836 RepID=UPI002948DCAE|nr:hypothetical protein [Enterobacter hormaechei]MDV5717563.1 hypothetical protein [Enterobacter hormaechei]